MVRKAESALVDRIRRMLLRELPTGSWVRKLADRYTYGLPDLLVISRTVPDPEGPLPSMYELAVIALEVKIDRRQLSRLQAEEGRALNAIGDEIPSRCGQCRWFVVRSVKDVRDALESLGIIRQLKARVKEGQ